MISTYQKTPSQRGEQITPANAGGRFLFRFRGSRHRPAVAEFRR